MKLKRNDMVKVIAGKDRGKTGKIIQILPDENKIVVDGINRRVKHLRTRKTGEKGQRVEFFAPVDASNVMYVTTSGVASRIGATKLENGKKVRVAKKTKETISE